MAWKNRSAGVSPSTAQTFRQEVVANSRLSPATPAQFGHTTVEWLKKKQSPEKPARFRADRRLVGLVCAPVFTGLMYFACPALSDAYRMRRSNVFRNRLSMSRDFFHRPCTTESTWRTELAFFYFDTRCRLPNGHHSFRKDLPATFGRCPGGQVPAVFAPACVHGDNPRRGIGIGHLFEVREGLGVALGRGEREAGDRSLVPPVIDGLGSVLCVGKRQGTRHPRPPQHHLLPIIPGRNWRKAEFHLIG